MTIKIFGRLSSANVQKVVWFCNEADLSFKSFIFGEYMVERKQTCLSK